MTAPEMHAVKSTNVEAIGHDGAALHVRFKGGKTFTYAGVPESTFHAARSAESVGGFVARNIIGKYEHTKIDASDAVAGQPST